MFRRLLELEIHRKPRIDQCCKYGYLFQVRRVQNDQNLVEADKYLHESLTLKFDNCLFRP